MEKQISKTNIRVLFALVLTMGMAVQLRAQTIAFPGAEGWGRYTTGGRGGTVYHVTNLNDTGEGSFREAVGKSGTRTIVFDVSGTIYLKSALSISNGNVTIAGQTAPGDGICIAGYPFTISADNVIIRFMRFRLGNENVAYHEGDGLGGMDHKNIMIDHCSVSWSIDECLSVYGNKNQTVQWCIVSQSLCNSGHSKGSHGYGGNWGGAGASFHHNLLAHHNSRTPRLGPRPGTQLDERMDLRNNVIYNWAGNGCYGGEGMNVNIVNNYYKPGPATKTRSELYRYRIAAPGCRTVDYCISNQSAIITAYNSIKGTTFSSSSVVGSYSASEDKYYLTCGTTKYEIDMDASTINVDGTDIKIEWNDWKKMLHVWGLLYVDGNYNPDYPTMNSDNFYYGVSLQIDKTGNDGTYPGDDNVKISEPIDFESVTTHTAAVAYERVLEYAGCSLSRDWVDEQMVSDTRNGIATATGSKTNIPGIIDSQEDNKPSDADDDWSAWPELETDTDKDMTDSDGDGIPDVWESANGLDPNDASDGNAIPDEENGYTNLEIYMNSLVEDIMNAGNEGGEVLSQVTDSGDSDDDNIYETVATGTVTYLLVDENQQSTLSGICSDEISSYITAADVQLGESLSLGAITQVNDIYEQYFNTVAQENTADATNAITFTLTPDGDYYFRPTNLQMYISRIGTDGGAYDLSWVCGEKTTVIEESEQPNRNKAEYGWYTVYNKQVTVPAYNTDASLVLNIYKYANSKQIGVYNVIITGDVLECVGSGIREVDTGSSATVAGVYGIDGRMVMRNASPADVRFLPKGVYIVNGRKYIVR